MKAIYEFYWDCRRMGSVEGLFIAEKEDVKAAIGKEVRFGEILGKHSDVWGTLEEGECTVLTDDQEFIAKFEEIMGTGTISGYNPLEYISESEYEEDEDE